MVGALRRVDVVVIAAAGKYLLVVHFASIKIFVALECSRKILLKQTYYSTCDIMNLLEYEDCISERAFTYTEIGLDTPENEPFV